MARTSSRQTVLWAVQRHTVCSASHVRVAEPPRIEQINVDSLVFELLLTVSMFWTASLLLYEFYAGSRENGRESWLAARFERAEDGQWDPCWLQSRSRRTLTWRLGLMQSGIILRGTKLLKRLHGRLADA